MTVQTLDSVAYCCVYSLDLPYFLIPDIATTQVHRPTLASPVSVPASMTYTRGDSPTWASLVSIPAYRLPTQDFSPFRLQYYCIPISPPLLLLLLASHHSSRVAQSCFSVAFWRTTHSSSAPLIHTLSPLHIPQIRDVALPTAPRSSAVHPCKPYPTGFSMPPACLLLPASPISHILIVSLSSP